MALIDAAGNPAYRSSMADADKRASSRDPERLFPLAAFRGERPPAPDWFHAAIATPHVDGVIEVGGTPIRWRRSERCTAY